MRTHASIVSEKLEVVLIQLRNVLFEDIASILKTFDLNTLRLFFRGTLLIPLNKVYNELKTFTVIFWGFI